MKRINLLLVIILAISFISCGKASAPPCEHVWEKATCTSAQKCKKCGAVEGEPIGHTWKEATCYKAKTCTRCGITNGTKLSHQLSDGKCSKCGFDIRGYWSNHDSSQSLMFIFEESYDKEFEVSITLTKPNSVVLEGYITTRGKLKNREDGFNYTPIYNLSDFIKATGQLDIDITIIDDSTIQILNRKFHKV